MTQQSTIQNVDPTEVRATKREPCEVPDKLTPVTVDDITNDLVVHVEEIGSIPTRAAIELKVAHIALECGLEPDGSLPSCHNFNVGNRKHVDGDGFDWCCFGCGEEVNLDRMGQLPAAFRSPYVKRKGKPYQAHGVVKQSVEVSPPHPASRFVAHESLRDGMRGQYKYLVRHPKVLEALLTGDPEVYNRALFEASYYTASTRVYLSALKTRLTQVRRLLENWDGWGDVP